MLGPREVVFLLGLWWIVFFILLYVLFFFNSTHLKIRQPAQVQVMIAEPGDPDTHDMPPGLLWALFASLKDKFLFYWLLVPLPLPWPSDYGIWVLIFSNKSSRKFSIFIFHCPIRKFPKCRPYQQINPDIPMLFQTFHNFWSKG